MDAIIAQLVDPWHRRMAAVVREHSRAEMIGDVDAIMATLAPDPKYRFHGATFFEPFEIDTTGGARTMYEAIVASGYLPAGAFDDQKWYFNDHGVVLQGRPTTIVPGAGLKPIDGLTIDPAMAYRIRYPLIQSHGFDPAVGLMEGEIVYFGALLGIEEVPPPQASH